MKYIATLIFALVLAGCSSQPAGFDYDSKFNFNQRLNISVDSSSTKVLGLDGERVSKALSDGFRARGWHVGPSQPYKASFYIKPMGKKDSGVRVGIGGGSYRHRGISLGGGISIPIGSGKQSHLLEVIIEDAQGATLWYGSGEWAIKETASPTEREDTIRLLVAKVISTIPK